MSAPIINPAVNFNVWKRGQYFSYLLAASNVPTSWSVILTDYAGAVVALADIGLTLNTTTGLVQGAFLQAGFYNLHVTATNASGSGSLDVPVGIRPVSFDLSTSTGIFVDVETGLVTLRGQPASLWGKYGSQRFVDVGFVKRGILLDDLSVDTITLGLKEYEPEGLLDLTDGQFQVSSGIYRILVNLDTTKLGSVLGDYEDDKQTRFKAIAEIRYGYYEVTVTGGSPMLLADRSGNFEFIVERDLIPN
jgi:hypothetical protein